MLSVVSVHFIYIKNKLTSKLTLLLYYHPHGNVLFSNFAKVD